MRVETPPSSFFFIFWITLVCPMPEDVKAADTTVHLGGLDVPAVLPCGVMWEGLSTKSFR